MNGRDSRDDPLFLWCALLIFVFAVLPALYVAHADDVNTPLLALAEAQIQVFAPFFDEAQTAWARIAEADPASLSWDTMHTVLRYTGSWIRWPFLLLLVLLGVASIFMGRVGGLVRRFNMESLLKNNAESFPCLRPVVGRTSICSRRNPMILVCGGSPGLPSSSRWNTDCYVMNRVSRSRRNRR